jgi:tetratricopeptide (TPR) repeat protein
MTNPLMESGTVRRGSHLAFRHSGAWMEPVTRQFLFDFEGKGRLLEVEGGKLTPAQRDGRVAGLFLRAVRCEEAGKTADAITIYESILELDPRHAPSAINLGTIFYNQRQYLLSEQLYRRATEADSAYALAFFDLGNVLDELQRLPEAIEAYTTAIRLVPHYGDAHYNVALAYERVGDRRAALRHWTTYIKLDPIGPWSNHARIQARKILEREKLSIVHRGSAVLHDHHLRRARPVPRLLAVPKPMLPM